MAGPAGSPISPSSSPSFPPASAHSPNALSSWHFPGPSSVFHKREKDAIRHRRGESYTTPVAPILSTERRAQHRRVKSSAALSGASLHWPSMPATSDKSRSPLSRFASYTSETMAAADPATPARPGASSRPDSKLQDSPFSDYFTDDGRSLNESGYTAPSSQAQQVLLRLNKIQSQLMRGADGESERDVLSAVDRKLDSIELALSSIHSQTRMPLEDSGLFLEEEEDEVEDEKSITPSGLGVQYDGAQDDLEEQPTKEQKQAEHDYLLLQAQNVLANVTKAQANLKKRHAEIREINDMHMLDLEEKDRQIEGLKSENEGMQLDLNHDHSELLFLKLQFKALEVQLDALDDDENSTAAPKLSQRKKLQEEMDRWRSDWADVEGRMKRRRSRYGVVSPLSRRDSHAESNADDDGIDTDWKLETVKTRHARVESIVIRRTTSAGHALEADGADDAKDGPEPLAAKRSDSTSERSSTPKPAYAEQATQTESIPLSWLDATEDFEDDAATPALEPDDCAITTSSEADETEFGGFDEQNESEEPIKSPWQDLWDSLSSFAGMGDERF